MNETCNFRGKSLIRLSVRCSLGSFSVRVFLLILTCGVFVSARAVIVEPHLFLKIE